MNEQHYQVFQIIKSDTYGNSHSVCRDETWTVNKVREFPTLEEAEEYVIQQSRVIMVRFTNNITEEFAREFCFDNDRWYADRTFFIGRPNIQKMALALENNGVRVLKC